MHKLESLPHPCRLINGDSEQSIDIIPGMGWDETTSAEKLIALLELSFRKDCRSLGKVKKFSWSIVEPVTTLHV